MVICLQTPNILNRWQKLLFSVTKCVYQCGFQRKRSITDQIFCTCQKMETKWEYNETVHQLFIDFKKVYDSVMREVLYNILIEFGVPMKQVRLKKMCLNEM
jgi:hypothetical protein